MSFVIVPNHISEAIYRKVDEAIAAQPAALPDREFFYRELLTYFNEHGVIPDFTLAATVLSDRTCDNHSE